MDNPAALIAVIKHLENEVGKRVGYKILEPFPCVTLNGLEPAIITIQNAGKIIADHVGLSSLTFVIPGVIDQRITAHLASTSPSAYV
jgi:hypothetical protein